jgi:hypothetical protein
MKLSDYPSAIAQSAKNLLKAERSLKSSKTKVDEITSQIDAAIAFDPELKNDVQRKAKRTELLQAECYVDAFTEFRFRTEQLEDQQVEHQLLKDQFTVAKLESRQAIASLEANAIAA